MNFKKKFKPSNFILFLEKRILVFRIRLYCGPPGKNGIHGYFQTIQTL